MYVYKLNVTALCHISNHPRFKYVIGVCCDNRTARQFTYTVPRTSNSLENPRYFAWGHVSY